MPPRGYKFTPDQMAAAADRARGNKWCVGRQVSAATRARMSRSLRERHQKKIAAGLVDPALASRVDCQRQKMKNTLKSLLRAAKLRKNATTAETLGYDRNVLVAHIAAQFRPGMSWDDRRSFSIDHRVPVVEFIRRGITDPKIVCSLQNLQPLPPKENRMKSDKYDGSKFDADLAEILAFNEKAIYSHGLKGAA